MLALASVAAATRRPAAAPAACERSAQWDSLVLAHHARYPLMGARDALKLLQHATMGSDHAVTDHAAAMQWMEREWERLHDGDRGEPMVDTLGAGGMYARVHLREIRKAGGRPSALVDAFVRTSREHRGDTLQLACAVDALKALTRRRAMPWSADSVDAISTDWAAHGYPAMGHTPAYRAAYQPAYRVIALSLLPHALTR